MVRKHYDELKKKNVDVFIIAEDLRIIAPDTTPPYRPPIGKSWRNFLPKGKELGTVKALREHILSMIKERKCNEIFVALNKHFQTLLPDLITCSCKMLSNFSGIGSMVQALKLRLSECG
ncbi:MAG: hypothetical protein ABWK01_06455 [Infirmifilum sp.]